MKKTLLLLSLFGTFASAWAVPSFEPFADATSSGGTSYTPGTPLFRQTNALGDVWWAINGTSTTTCVSNTAGSLSYAGLPASTGNAIKLRNVTGTGARMFVATNSSGFFSTTTPGLNSQVYYSMLLQVADVTSLSTVGDYCFGFNNQATIGDQSGQPGNVCARLYFKKNGSGYQLGIAKAGATAAAVTNYDSTVHSTSETVFVVVQYDVVGGFGTDDNVRLWINPSASSFGAALPPPETVNVLAQDTDENTYISTFVFEHRSTATPNTLIVDDFRLGTTWAFVTGGPEIYPPLPATTEAITASTLVLQATARSGGPLSSYPLSYGWQKNGVTLQNGDLGGRVSGATTAALSIAGMSSADNGTYAVVVSNNFASATSSTVVTVTTDPGIVTQPTNVTTNYGAAVTFTSVGAGSGTLTYRWQKDGVDLVNGPSASGATISGATTTTLTIAGTGVGWQDAGVYTLTVTNGSGATATSSGATLVVRDPYISVQPASTNVVLGGTATFTVTGGGSPPVSYTWYRGAVQLTDGGNISGSTTNVLRISPVGGADIGAYTVVIASGSGSNVTSAVAALTVSAAPGQLLYWDDNGPTPGTTSAPQGTWGSDPFWSTDSTGSLPTSGWFDGATAVFAAGSDSLFSAYTVTVIATQTVAGLTFEDGNVTLSGGTLQLANPTGQAQFDAATNQTFSIITSGTVGSVVAGTNNVLKTGLGTVRFNGANTYSGRTILKAGTFQLAQDNRLGAAPASVVADSVTLDGGTMDWVNTSAQAVNVNRGFTITTNGGTITKSAGSVAVTINGPITGPGKLTKTGVGTLTLTTSNSYAGGLDVLGGQVNLNSLDLFNGQGWLTFAGGSGPIQLADGVTLRAANVTVTGPVDPISTNSTVIVTNKIVLLGGFATLGPGGGGVQPHVNYAGVISGSGGIIRQNVGDKVMILSAINTFSGGLQLLQRPLALGNKYALGTGTLTIGDPFTAPANVISLGGASNLFGADAVTNPVVIYQQVGMPVSTALPYGIELSGPIELGNPNVPIYANIATVTNVFSGVVGSTNSYGFIKEGVGTLVLSGNNTYAGGTTVAAGTLAVNNATGSGTGTGAVTVNAGALVGIGTIGGAVSISGGLVSGGPGLTAVGKLSFTSGLDMSTPGVTNVWELGALKDDNSGVAGVDFDQLSVTGSNLVAGSGTTLALGFVGSASEPDPTASFWQVPHAWTVVKLSGGAVNTGGQAFGAIANGSFASGTFATSVAGNGSILLTYTPSAPYIQSVTANATSISMSWSSLSGTNYQVIYKTNLTQAAWMFLANVPGTGGIVSYTDNHGADPQRFYRIAVAP